MTINVFSSDPQLVLQIIEFSSDRDQAQILLLSRNTRIIFERWRHNQLMLPIVNIIKSLPSEFSAEKRSIEALPAIFHACKLSVRSKDFIIRKTILSILKIKECSDSNAFLNMKSIAECDPHGLLKINREVTKSALQVLEWQCPPMSPDFFHDREICLMIMKDNNRYFHLMPKTLPHFSEAALIAVRQSATALKDIPVETPRYAEIAKMSVECHPESIQHIPRGAIPNYFELALIVAKNYYNALALIPKIERYLEIVVAHLKKFPENFSLIAQSRFSEEEKQNCLLQDLDLTSTIIALGPEYISMIPISHPQYDNIILNALKKRFLVGLSRQEDIIKHISRKHPRYLEFVREAVKCKPESIQNAIRNIADPEFYKAVISTALEVNPSAFNSLEDDDRVKFIELSLPKLASDIQPSAPS